MHINIFQKLFIYFIAGIFINLMFVHNGIYCNPTKFIKLFKIKRIQNALMIPVIIFLYQWLNKNVFYHINIEMLLIIIAFVYLIFIPIGIVTSCICISAFQIKKINLMSKIGLFISTTLPILDIITIYVLIRLKIKIFKNR